MGGILVRTRGILVRKGALAAALAPAWSSSCAEWIVRPVPFSIRTPRASCANTAL